MLISVKRAVAILSVLVFTLTFLIFADNHATPVGSFGGTTIVVDPGHGLPDGGAVGESGITENEINLKVSKYLEEILTDMGYNVIMTRRDENGIYSAESKTVRNKKREDLKKRVDISNTSNASLLVSIHMNAFPLETCRGPQIFYCASSSDGEKAADSIRTAFIEKIGEHCNREIKPVKDGLYLLCHTKIPSVLVECGFLSNSAEEKLLISDDYQKLLAQSISEGIAACCPIIPVQ